MVRKTALFLLLSACTPDYDSVLVYDYDGEGAHTVRPVQIPSLTDPVRVSGPLGDATLGGRIAFGDDGLRWERGPRVHLDYAVDDGVLVPMDDQGMVLLSFYHHLAAVRDDLGERGWQADMDAIFPLTTFAWMPSQVTTDYLAVENAAYVSAGIHAFVLYEEANLHVPLTAHAGVVRHEFGHAWFAERLPQVDSPDDSDIEVDDSRSLNEGFADMVAVLSLDDPDALPIEGRDPRDDHSLAGVVDGDPYSLGVVLAGFAWDVRLILDDAPRTLELVILALDEWNAGVQAELLAPVSLAWIIPFYDLAAAETDDPALCEAFRQRFPGVDERCSD